ncbi:MAG: hypothetical protein R3321_14320 [Nitrososphaeraceae archaeon]|nr:hypothetical protein [Nitrososphaeraceae archaeon]
MDIDQLREQVNEMEAWQVLDLFKELLRNYDYTKEYSEVTDDYGNPRYLTLLSVVDLLTRQ